MHGTLMPGSSGFPGSFPFIENQTNQWNQTAMGGMAVGSDGSGRARGQ